MLSRRRTASLRTARKQAALYVDRAGSCAIVVPMHYNGEGGFLFEDPEPQVLRPLPGPAELGAAVLAALDRSRVKPETSHRDAKLTDWPAYGASGAPSVRRFEADYIRIGVAGENEANIVYRIEGSPEKDAELRIVASASPNAVDRFGERCLSVWRACRDRSF